MRILAITNQKGGVGKTTTCVNLAASLAATKRRVLLIDLDPQGNATTGSGVDKSAMKQTVYHVLIGKKTLKEVMQPSIKGKFDVIPANRDLAGAEVELVNEIARETRLKVALAELGDNYDYVLIDCPPALNLITVNALTAAHAVMIPMQCEYYALEGLAYFMEAMSKIRDAVNESLHIEGIVMTMYDPRVSLGGQVRAEIETHFKDQLFATTIPRNVRLAEAPSFGKTILQYDPRSKGSEAYVLLAKELLVRKGAKDLGPAAQPRALAAV